MRGIFNNPGIRFRDPSATRLDAYRRGLEAIRRGAGPDAYLCVCGGHFGGSLGLADAQRSGSDMRGWWEVMKPRIKQNLLRTWMHRLWHVDPDAMLLRRREEPLVEGVMGSYTLGRLSDDEARTVVLNQYLGGQLICLGEAFRHLDEDRRALLRHAIPSIGSPAVPLDPLEPVAPSQLVTRVTPRCRGLEPWNTLALINWSDAPQRMQASLSGEAVRGLQADRFLVTEFFTDSSDRGGRRRREHRPRPRGPARQPAAADRPVARRRARAGRHRSQLLGRWGGGRRVAPRRGRGRRQGGDRLGLPLPRQGRLSAGGGLCLRFSCGAGGRGRVQGGGVRLSIWIRRLRAFRWNHPSGRVAHVFQARIGLLFPDTSEDLLEVVTALSGKFVPYFADFSHDRVISHR